MVLPPGAGTAAVSGIDQFHITNGAVDVQVILWVEPTTHCSVPTGEVIPIVPLIVIGLLVLDSEYTVGSFKETTSTTTVVLIELGMVQL